MAIPLAAALTASTGRPITLRVSDRADLVLTGRDLAGLAPEELREMPVAATVLEGRVTYRGE